MIVMDWKKHPVTGFVGTNTPIVLLRIRRLLLFLRLRILAHVAQLGRKEHRQATNHTESTHRQAEHDTNEAEKDISLVLSKALGEQRIAADISLGILGVVDVESLIELSQRVNRRVGTEHHKDGNSTHSLDDDLDVTTLEKCYTTKVLSQDVREGKTHDKEDTKDQNIQEANNSHTEIKGIQIIEKKQLIVHRTDLTGKKIMMTE